MLQADIYQRKAFFEYRKRNSNTYHSIIQLQPYIGLVVITGA